MAVDVKLAPSFEHGSPRVLFDARMIGGVGSVGSFRYDVAPDGRRFLVITRPSTEEAAPTSIVVALNWTSSLKW